MKSKHPLADVFESEIRRVREGDIAAAQRMMRHCAKALREHLSYGSNNLASQHADYLAEVLDRLADKKSTARMFCIDMPPHRPKQNDDPAIHIGRARKVLATFQCCGRLDAAMKTVATAECKSIGAVRASWNKKGFVAEFELLYDTPESQRNEVRLPGALRNVIPKWKGEA